MKIRVNVNAENEVAIMTMIMFTMGMFNLASVEFCKFAGVTLCTVKFDYEGSMSVYNVLRFIADEAKAHKINLTEVKMHVGLVTLHAGNGIEPTISRPNYEMDSIIIDEWTSAKGVFAE